MIPYDNEKLGFPAPIAIAEIAAPFGKSRSQTVRMIFDYGAEITLIPEDALSKLRNNLPIGDPIIIESPTGNRHPQDTYYVSVRFEDQHFEMIEVTGIKGNMGILGLNLLNQLLTVFDGSAWHAWRIWRTWHSNGDS